MPAQRPTPESLATELGVSRPTVGARAAVDARGPAALHVPIIGFDDTPVAQPVVRAARTSVTISTVTGVPRLRDRHTSVPRNRNQPD